MHTDLSFAEEQLWLAHQASSLALPFFDCTESLSLVVKLENALNREALQASLDHIVRRHDVLRSRFAIREGRPVRLLRRSSSAQLTSIDLRRDATGDGAEAATRVLERHVRQRFDLTRGPLLRALLVRLADDEHILAITVHHIVFDRWSKRVLARELQQYYDAYANGRMPGDEPLRAQYGDYVEWQRRRLESAFSRELVAYWTDRLRGLSDQGIPGDSIPGDGDDGREPGASTRAGRWSFTISEEQTNRLVALSRRCRVTLATVLLAIVTLLLNRLSGRDDIAIGLPLSDRRHPDFEPLIGLFANVVVVRTRIADGLTFLELLDRVRRDVFDACRYQDLPYGHLLHVVGARTPLHRVVFNFLPAIPASQVELTGLRVTPLSVPAEQPSLADLSLHVRREADGLSCRLVYKADVFTPAWAQACAALFDQLVAAVLDGPQQDVGSRVFRESAQEGDTHGGHARQRTGDRPTD